jgi:hypothetical protein
MADLVADVLGATKKSTMVNYNFRSFASLNHVLSSFDLFASTQRYLVSPSNLTCPRRSSCRSLSAPQSTARTRLAQASECACIKQIKLMHQLIC